MPRWSPEIPSNAIVVPSGLDAVARCGVLNDAENEMEPAVSAVRRMTITWSGALAKTSRRYFTLFAVYVTTVVAVVRSSHRWYPDTPLALGKASLRSPTGW